MNLNQPVPKDPYIFLSWINMKLRDEGRDLDDLCYEYNINQEEIISVLKDIGYYYNKVNNQFITMVS